MHKADLILESYFIERLSFALCDGFEPQTAESLALVLDSDDIECQTERADLEEARHAAYRLALRFEAKPDKSPYEWHIALIGYFRVSEARSESDAQSLLDGNAPALLYGAAREVLASALGRGPYSAPFLPTVYFAAPAASPEKPKTKRKPKRAAEKN